MIDLYKHVRRYGLPVLTSYGWWCVVCVAFVVGFACGWFS